MHLIKQAEKIASIHCDNRFDYDNMEKKHGKLDKFSIGLFVKVSRLNVKTQKR